VKNLLGGDETMSGSRTPDIMADSAYIILTSDSKKTTDNFFLDDEVILSEHGDVDSLDKYKPKGLPNGKLVLDFMS
jgi:citronellol/citronellal dehydrogenase